MALPTALRPHRFELLGVAVLGLVCFLLVGGLTIRLGASGIPVECFSIGEQPVVCDEQRRAIEAYGETIERWNLPAFVAIALLPAISGLILGAALIGKEIDQRTTLFAWSLSPSRRRWLLLRVLPVGTAVVAASLVAGIFGDILQGLYVPGDDPTRSFVGLGVRGVVAAGAALSAFGVSLLVGSVLGRLLPVMLIASGLVLAVHLSVAAVNDVILQGETVLVEQDARNPGRVVDSRAVTPEGEIITWEEAYERYGSTAAETLRMLLVVNPGEIYPLVVARAAVMHAAIGLFAITLSFAVVDRRRP